MRMKKTAVIAMGILFFSLAVSAVSSSTISVNVNVANVREQPDLNSKVVAQVPFGTVFEVRDKIGEWYMIGIRPENSAVQIVAYIHQSVVSVVEPDIQPDSSIVIKVKFDQVNVMSEPDFMSQIIAQIPKRKKLTSTGKTGEWYFVEFTRDTDDSLISGYIHQVGVDEIKSRAAKTRGSKEKPPKPLRPGMKPPHKESIVSGFFAKYGQMFSPKPAGDEQTWILSFGYDHGLHRNFSVGIEIQPAYRNDKVLELSVFPVMMFINGKGSINAEGLWDKLNFLNLFSGIGVGSELSFASATFDGEKLTDSQIRFAFHLLFGMEIMIKKIAVILEYQIASISNPDVDPNFLRHFAFIGIRF